MAPVYSHSRLSTFEDCPYRYKLRYLDRVKVEQDTTIEQFLGSRVHDALEWLYEMLQKGRTATEPELQEKFKELWEQAWEENIKIVRDDLSAEHYQEVGRRCLHDYYHRHEPFDSGRTVGLEIRIEIWLSDGKRLQGFIDRLEKTPKGSWRIHDYKTSQKLPDQATADRDRQLALYALGVMDRFPEATAENIELVWHYVAFDDVVTSTRTSKQLEALEQTTIELIDKVELAVEKRDLPPSPGHLCDWCEYQNLCPEFAHKFKLNEQNGERPVSPQHPGLAGSGGQMSLVASHLSVQEASSLVDELVRVQNEGKEMKQREQELKDQLAEYSRQTGQTTIFGTERKVRMTEVRSQRLPKDTKIREQLVNKLEEADLMRSCQSLSLPRLKSLLQEPPEGTDPKTIQELERLLERSTSYRFSISKR